MRAFLVVALLLMAGCVTEQEGVGGAFVVPALPTEFHAVYETKDGDRITAEGSTTRTLDRFGRLADVLVVELDGNERGTFAFDACAGPAWTATTDPEYARVDFQNSHKSAPIWLRAQGVTLTPDLVLEQFGNQQTRVIHVKADGFKVADAGSHWDLRYGAEALPEQWARHDGTTWDLTEYTSSPEATCGLPKAAPMSQYGADGPGQHPEFDSWDLPSVLAYARGPLGPPEFSQWESEHSKAWLAQFMFSPPFLSPIPDEARPANWLLVFSDVQQTAGLRLYCDADIADGILPALRPNRCRTQSEEVPLADQPPEPYPDSRLLADTLRLLGLNVSALTGHANATSAGVTVQSWDKRTTATGFEIQIYWLGLDREGRLAWSSMPQGIGLLGPGS